MSNQEDSFTSASPKSKVTLSLDLRLVVAALVVVILAMLAIWKPWSAPVSNRTVQVTGSTKVTAKPDEFVFYPSYQFKGADQTTALNNLTKKSDEITTKLKSLGVSDSKIKTNSSGYDYPIAYDTANNATYTLQLTITVSSLAQAQKVEDYLVTTSPTGMVSPQANFSQKKRDQLEEQARNQATKNARAKGEQMAANLGFKLGKVKTVEDGTGFGTVMPLQRGMGAAESATSGSLKIQPGENDLDYSVIVTYFIN